MYNEKIFFNPNRPANISISPNSPKGSFSNIHFHPELEFLYIQNGRMRCYNDNFEATVNEEEIIFINSKIPHATEFLKENSSQTVVQFRNPSMLRNNLKYLSDFLKQSPVSFFVFKKDDPDYPELKNYISDITTNNKAIGIAHDYYITSNIYRIIALLYKREFLSADETTLDKKTLRTLMPIFDYISDNYNEELSLDFFAKLLSINKNYLCRLFKKATGTTITEYLNFVRICKAEELLKKNLSISDVAYSVGFSSLSYFNRIFKKYKQCSPSYYKSMCRHKDEFS